ncbi:ATP-dependent zinc metalloprotease FtsH [Barnesiella viscericola]|uniref:ATP-dependent zinc metalloprotease FtsH n=1 Tax=Barnesiella viscericola TaxID=397865 RepID=UPI0025A3CF33|nr:ATP-dependent zinc metalloprotease FtsH [Barnesiella viscericola]MDM8267418.1 ATP-dependent zinc metalloprotease FtsH [Barnesiella viscericola]
MGNNNMSPLGPNKKKRVRFNLYWMYAIIALLLFGLYYANDPSMSKEVNWSEFEKIAKEGGMTNVTVHAKKDYVEAQLNDSTAKAIFKTDKITGKPIVYTNIPSGDSFATTLEAWKKDYGFNADVNYENSSDLTNILWTFGPIVFFIIFWIYLARRMTNQGGGGGGGVFNVGKAKAQLFDKDGAVKVTFDDVAGLSEAKQEVEEIVEFLKNPSRYTDLGGKIPKGALLVGPPGTGKTLLAKAVAGEANVPFFSLSGSDFVEMFVGVGASRVRDLFRQAKEKAPCIVFIDEIDAVGRARGKNPNMGSNDERENTLNQLLTEMDGFGSNSGVIILAATNRADILDKALLRAGRFDRQIYVELPELNDRKAIFKVHLRNVKIDDSVDVDLLARQTPGFSGADIANVCNEAALIAARKNKKSVQRQDFMDAVDRIVGGLEKRSKITTQEEKRSIAIHEAGHASISWLLQYANPLIKVTIVPRGRALGAAWYLPEERQITTREQMLDEMCATLGGRAAEEVFLGRISTGASNDLERVTKQAYAMVVYFGMSEQLPNLSYYDSTGQEYGFTKPYSEDTAKLIDKEVSRIVNEQYERAKSILRENAEKHAKLAEVLITREVIFAEDVEQIFGKRPWISRTEEILQDEEAAKKEEEAEHKKSETEGNQTPGDEKPATGDSGNSNDQPKAENGETKENEKDTPDAKA